jgi:hypothetical protein
MDMKPVVAFIHELNFRYQRGGKSARSYLANRLESFYIIAEKHKSRFISEPRLGRLFYQVAAVDNIRLNNFREGRSLMWKGYKKQLQSVIGLLRALATISEFTMKLVWKRKSI